MRKPIVLLTLVLALSTPVIPTAQAAAVYRPGEGWNAEDEDSGAAEATASAQLHKAEGLEASGDSKRALGAYRTLVRSFPASGAAPSAQIKIAELYATNHDLEKAFDAYGKYLSKYPRGQQFEEAVEGQFKIAQSFLQGERRKVFGVKTFSSMERAQQMFEQIVKNAPFSKWAALSQFNVGQALEKQTKYPEAIAAYQLAVDKYSTDDVAADAQYQIGFIYLKLTRAGSNDQAARVKAREAFEDFMMRYPQSEKVPQAQENIKTLAGTDTRSSLGVGEFYERSKNYKAAVIYYEDVIKGSPGTAEATDAQKHIDHLKSTQTEDKLRAGPERAETGAKAQEHRKLQARVETASRPDFAGPPAPVVPDEVPPEKPKLRTSGSADAAPLLPTEPLPPAPEPSLPSR